jgi:hypothetical protein
VAGIIREAYYDTDLAGEARRLLREEGAEGFGWYQPFHVWDEANWGIYLHEKRLIGLALVLVEDGIPDFFKAIRIAFGKVYRHELFHAQVEASASWLEMTSLAPRYRTYSKKVYKKKQFTSDWREEALANFEAMQRVREKHGDNAFRILKELLELSPPGYRDWESGDRLTTWRAFATELATGTPIDSTGERLLPLEGVLRQKGGFDLRPEDVPTRIVGQGHLADALFSVPSRKEAVKFLKHQGYGLVKGGKGSHEKWRGPDTHGPNSRCFQLPQVPAGRGFRGRNRLGLCPVTHAPHEALGLDADLFAVLPDRLRSDERRGRHQRLRGERRLAVAAEGDGEG